MSEQAATSKELPKKAQFKKEPEKQLEGKTNTSKGMAERTQNYGAIICESGIGGPYIGGRELGDNIDLLQHGGTDIRVKLRFSRGVDESHWTGFTLEFPMDDPDDCDNRGFGTRYQPYAHMREMARLETADHHKIQVTDDPFLPILRFVSRHLTYVSRTCGTAADLLCAIGQISSSGLQSSHRDRGGQS